MDGGVDQDGVNQLRHAHMLREGGAGRSATWHPIEQCGSMRTNQPNFQIHGSADQPPHAQSCRLLPPCLQHRALVCVGQVVAVLLFQILQLRSLTQLVGQGLRARKHDGEVREMRN